jgi:heterodisulfide reductase subunit A-like polyferredoxin
VRYARVPGIRIFVKADKCTGCSKCVREGFCRFGAISVVERKATINERRCRRCMRCTHLCPRNALAIEIRPPQVVQDTLRQVDNEIDQRLKGK